MKKKTTLRMLVLLAILICSIVAPILLQTYMVRGSKSSYDSDYMTVSGVLSTDSYVLFPFQKKNLTIGFSKYGELIDYETKTGLHYSGDDAFAPGSSKVTEAQWVEGWILNITYVEGGEYKNIWARATYSDYHGSGSEGIAGDWNEDATDGSTGTTVRGGRKTNGGAVTDSIKVLYNGPRRFVALLKTAIYASSSHATSLVDLTFTIVFNKVKKQVIVFKDIKRTDVGKNIGDMQIEFSNRGEWDLGDGTPPKSYAHFYEGQSTLYDGHYQAWYNANGIPSTYNGTYDVCQIIDDELQYAGWVAHWPRPIIGWVGATQIEANRGLILTTTSTNTLSLNGTAISNRQIDLDSYETPISYPQKNATGTYWIEDPMVFVNNQFKIINGSQAATKVTYYRSTNIVEFPTGYVPTSSDDIIIVYKYSTEQDDMGSEPNSPFVIGEWAFKMYESTDMFRAVSIFGVTDLNDGEDSNCATHDENKLDAEVQYYLNETFNPFDLYSAVEKQEWRWVEKETLSSALTVGTNYTLTSGLDDSIYTLSKSHATFTAEWVNEYEDGVDAHSKNWAALMQVNCTAQSDQHTDLKIVPPGAGTTLKFKDLVDLDFWYYLYSSPSPTYGPHVCVYLSKTGGRTSGERADITMMTNTNTTTGTWLHVTLPTIADYVQTGDGDQAFLIFYDSAVAADWSSATQGPTNPHSLNYWQGLNGSITENYIVDYIQVELGWWSSGVAKALIDDVSIGYLDRTSGVKYQRVYNLEEDKLIPGNWADYCSFAEKVLINGTLAIPYRANVTNPIFSYYNYTVNFETGNITFAQTLKINTRVKILYSTIEENEKGRYEWIIVGKDAATIDSIGAAYITEAFDSKKDIEVTMTGMDIKDTTYGPYAPFVMGGATSGTKSDYRDSLCRPHLKDDWCNTMAISSSNMIFEGGPIAQLGTEYFNEFTDAFFASSTYVTNDTGHSNKILALSCWSRNATASGYGTIAVYKDLNGTIGLVIWGFDGQDTYYISKWFWTTGIEYLQTENRGVTAIMLKITYPTADPTHPTVSIVEHLGTISEKDQHDC